MLRILAVGNSFSEDATYYLHQNIMHIYFFHGSNSNAV